MAKLGCAQARQARRLSYIALCPTGVWTASFPRSGLAAILMQPRMTPTVSKKHRRWRDHTPDGTPTNDRGRDDGLGRPSLRTGQALFAHQMWRATFDALCGLLTYVALSSVAVRVVRVS